MVTPQGKREAAAYVEEAHHVSERRACRVLGVERSLARYSFTRPPDTAPSKEPTPVKTSDAPQADPHPFGYG